MQRKLVVHKEYLFSLKSDFPIIADLIEKERPDGLAKLIMKNSDDQKLDTKTAELIKSIKINELKDCPSRKRVLDMSRWCPGRVHKK